MRLYKKYLRIETIFQNPEYSPRSISDDITPISAHLIDVVCDGESTSIFIKEMYASLGLGEFISPRWRFISFTDSRFRVGRPSPWVNFIMCSTGRQRDRKFIQETGDGYMSLKYNTTLRVTIISCILSSDLFKLRLIISSLHSRVCILPRIIDVIDVWTNLALDTSKRSTGDRP